MFFLIKYKKPAFEVLMNHYVLAGIVAHFILLSTKFLTILI